MATAPSYGLITSLDELAQCATQVIAAGGPIGFDCETGYDGPERPGASTHPEENFTCGFSFTCSTDWARYVPIRHEGGVNLDPAAALYWLWRLLASGRGVAHNAEFEERTLSREFAELLSDHAEVGAAVQRGCPEQGFFGPGYFRLRSDTMLEAHAEGMHKSVALKNLTRETFHVEQPELLSLFPPLTKKQEECIRFNVLDQHRPEVIAYACEDAVWALAHHQLRYPQLTSSSAERGFIYRVEMAVLPVVCAMEDEGVCYDWHRMRESAIRAREFAGRLQTEVSADLTQLIREKNPGAPPVSVNLASPKQLGDVLYGQLGLPVRHRTDTGAPSTGKLAMKHHAQTHPVVAKVQNWKSLMRLCGSYLDKYDQECRWAPDDRAHPRYLQTGVPAGRFAAKDPPVQQSPKVYRYVLADGATFLHHFRDNIMAPPGWYGLGFDLAQQELRIIAGEAGEEVMCQAFRDGIDVHSKTASLMLGKDMADVTPDDRAIGKTLGLALGYSLSPSGLAERLHLTKDAAQELFDSYFGTYPRIARWMERTKEDAKACGYTVTRWSGRRVPIWEFASDNRRIYAKGEREAGNTPIQGAAADYIKVAMVRADQALRRAGLREWVRPCLNMHDALEWYVREDIAAAEVVGVLLPAVVFTTPALAQWPPMAAEWHIWRRWGSARDLEVLPGGGIRFKGGPAEPAVVESGEDEEGPELPAIDAARLQRALAVREEVVPSDPQISQTPRVTQPDGRPRTVVIRLPMAPQRAEFEALLALVREVSGPHHAVIVFPGDEIAVAARTGLEPASHAHRVALAAPGAVLAWSGESVAAADLVRGVTL